jgi:signal transduction histidine kinase
MYVPLSRRRHSSFGTRMCSHSLANDLHSLSFVQEVRNPLSSAITALSFVSAAAAELEHHSTTKDAIQEDIAIVDTSLQFIDELLRNMLDMQRASDRHMTVCRITLCIESTFITFLTRCR